MAVPRVSTRRQRDAVAATARARTRARGYGSRPPVELRFVGAGGASPDASVFEKNWAPLVAGGAEGDRLYMSQSIEPHVVCAVDPLEPAREPTTLNALSRGRIVACREAFSTSNAALARVQERAPVRGGSPAVDVPPGHHPRAKLMVVHYDTGGRNYENVLVLDAAPPFAITNVSRPLPLRCPPRLPKPYPGSRVCFASGAQFARAGVRTVGHYVRAGGARRACGRFRGSRSRSSAQTPRSRCRTDFELSLTKMAKRRFRSHGRACNAVPPGSPGGRYRGGG